MTKASSFILRLYFALVSAVTLFTLMFGAIDFLSLGLKTYIFKAADVPDYLENCSQSITYNKPVVVEGQTPVSDEELAKQCEARNAQTIENYHRTKATDAVRNLALIIVSLPLFVLHFRIVLRDWREERSSKEK